MLRKFARLLEMVPSVIDFGKEASFERCGQRRLEGPKPKRVGGHRKPCPRVKVSTVWTNVVRARDPIEFAARMIEAQEMSELMDEDGQQLSFEQLPGAPEGPNPYNDISLYDLAATRRRRSCINLGKGLALVTRGRPVIQLLNKD